MIMEANLYILPDFYMIKSHFQPNIPFDDNHCWGEWSPGNGICYENHITFTLFFWKDL